MRREATFFINITAQAECAIYYRRILTFIKHVLSDGLSDGAYFSFYGEMTAVMNMYCPNMMRLHKKALNHLKGLME